MGKGLDEGLKRVPRSNGGGLLGLGFPGEEAMDLSRSKIYEARVCEID